VVDAHVVELRYVEHIVAAEGIGMDHAVKQGLSVISCVWGIMG
jgi:hypothetical protein